MNRNDLIEQLNLLGVSANSYSLNGELFPDRIVMYHSYNDWEVFYLDERGGRNDERVFSSEDDACRYIYKLFKESKDIEDKYLKDLS